MPVALDIADRFMALSLAYCASFSVTATFFTSFLCFEDFNCIIVSILEIVNRLLKLFFFILKTFIDYNNNFCYSKEKQEGDK